MYKVKYTAQGETSKAVYFNNLQEVTNYIKLICEAETLEEILETQKEYNIRFYVTEIKKINF